MRKRTMTPAVHDMTVKEERACLSEIREHGGKISHKHRLQNGWTAGGFALKYVTGHYRKRKNKEQPNVDCHTPVCSLDTDSAVDGEIDQYGHVCDPFSSRPPWLKDHQGKHPKRTQRYRSTAKSRILGMTVGDIRYCFQQLRNESDNLTPDFILYNGQCSGDFALCYLIETPNSTRNRQKKEGRLTIEQEKETQKLHYPDTQLPATSRLQTTYDGKVTFS